MFFRSYDPPNSFVRYVRTAIFLFFPLHRGMLRLGSLLHAQKFVKLELVVFQLLLQPPLSHGKSVQALTRTPFQFILNRMKRVYEKPEKARTSC